MIRTIAEHKLELQKLDEWMLTRVAEGKGISDQIAEAQEAWISLNAKIKEAESLSVLAFDKEMFGVGKTA